MFDLMVPDVYWSLENIDLIDDLKKNLFLHFPRDCKNCKSSYKNSSDKIKRLVNGMSLNTKRVLISTVRVPTPINNTLPSQFFFTKYYFTNYYRLPMLQTKLMIVYHNNFTSIFYKLDIRILILYLETF